jgi:hypothetical protein
MSARQKDIQRLGVLLRDIGVNDGLVGSDAVLNGYSNEVFSSHDLDTQAENMTLIFLCRSRTRDPRREPSGYRANMDA